MEASPSAAAMTEPFGPGCASVPATGDGSFEGMATAPVATAASANPVLSTLVSAVQAAGSSTPSTARRTSPSSRRATTPSPRSPPPSCKALLADKEMLTQVLTYHVVGQPSRPRTSAPQGRSTACRVRPSPPAAAARSSS
jgi:uncharacterized surface protein with fasciclin (FAS1) repeats